MVNWLQIRPSACASFKSQTKLVGKGQYCQMQSVAVMGSVTDSTDTN